MVTLCRALRCSYFNFLENKVDHWDSSTISFIYLFKYSILSVVWTSSKKTNKQTNVHHLSHQFYSQGQYGVILLFPNHNMTLWYSKPETADTQHFYMNFDFQENDWLTDWHSFIISFTTSHATPVQLTGQRSQTCPCWIGLISKYNVIFHTACTCNTALSRSQNIYDMSLSQGLMLRHFQA